MWGFRLIWLGTELCSLCAEAVGARGSSSSRSCFHLPCDLWGFLLLVSVSCSSFSCHSLWLYGTPFMGGTWRGRGTFCALRMNPQSPSRPVYPALSRVSGLFCPSLGEPRRMQGWRLVPALRQVRGGLQDESVWCRPLQATFIWLLFPWPELGMGFSWLFAVRTWWDSWGGGVCVKPWKRRGPLNAVAPRGFFSLSS